MSSSVAFSSEPSTGAGASDILQLTLDACDDRVFQPQYLFQSAPKLFEDKATLDFYVSGDTNNSTFKPKSIKPFKF